MHHIKPQTTQAANGICHSWGQYNLSHSWGHLCFTNTSCSHCNASWGVTESFHLIDLLFYHVTLILNFDLFLEMFTVEGPHFLADYLLKVIPFREIKFQFPLSKFWMDVPYMHKLKLHVQIHHRNTQIKFEFVIVQFENYSIFTWHANFVFILSLIYNTDLDYICRNQWRIWSTNRKCWNTRSHKCIMLTDNRFRYIITEYWQFILYLITFVLWHNKRPMGHIAHLSHI
jgi:hypothetical protein